MKRKLIKITQAVNAESITTKVIDGDKHFVIPSATLPNDIVMNGGLYPTAEIDKGYKSLEGVPAPMSHPKIDGKYVSAQDVRAINKFHVGAYVSNVERKNNKVYHDTVINERVALQTELGKSLIDAINKKEPIHTSTGVFLEREMLDEPTTNDAGVEYSWIARNLMHDHQAILLNETGAATPEDGVGLFVNADESEEELGVMFVNLDDFEVNDIEPLVTEAQRLTVFHKMAKALGFKVKPNQPNQKKVDPMKDKMIAALNAAGVNTEELTDDQLFIEHNKLVATNAAKEVVVPNALTAEDVANIFDERIAANEANTAKLAKTGLVEKVIAANAQYAEADTEMLLNTDAKILSGLLPEMQANRVGPSATVHTNADESLLTMKMEGEE